MAENRKFHIQPIVEKNTSNWKQQNKTAILMQSLLRNMIEAGIEIRSDQQIQYFIDKPEQRAGISNTRAGEQIETIISIFKKDKTPVETLTRSILINYKRNSISFLTQKK